LIKTSVLAASLLVMTAGQPCLRDHVSFDTDFARLKLETLHREAAPRNGRPVAHAHFEATGRKSQLWSPFTKTIRLAAVRDADGAVCTSPAGISGSLTAAWAPKFRPADTDRAAATAICQ
jgi:hypothetical protein